MEQYFEGKTALVTGAGWGIGAAIAMLYAAYGAKVIVSDTSGKLGRNTVERIRSKKGEATFIKADVCKASECEELIKKTINTYGSIDIACNNSAILSKLRRSSDKVMQALFDETELNLSGLFYCMKFEIEAMQKQPEGVIINMSSILGGTALASSDSYVGAKYGMTEETRDAPGDDSVRGIRINVIAPAFINEAMFENIKPTGKEEAKKFPAMGIAGKIQEVAEQVIWLSSYKAPFANGIY